jgi:hypothetical protein
MTFPLGGLPDSGTISQAGVSVPSKSVAFAGGGSDLDLTNLFGQKCAFEFYVTVAGNLVAALAGDVSAAFVPTTQTYIAVTVGQVIKGAFVLLKSSSTCSGIARA